MALIGLGLDRYVRIGTFATTWGTRRTCVRPERFGRTVLAGPGRSGRFPSVNGPPGELRADERSTGSVAIGYAQRRVHPPHVTVKYAVSWTNPQLSQSSRRRGT